jgi:hypothetical protein
VAAGGAPPVASDGCDVDAILLTDRASGEVARIERNEWGTFFKVFQANSWEKKRKEALARAAAAGAAAQAVIAA